jgi:hypothetical protein
MDLIDVLIYATVIWISLRVIHFVVTAFEISNLEDRVERLKYLNSIIHDVKIEKQDDMEYWFDKDSDQFLGQGKSVEEIASVLKSRFPEHVFLLGERGGIGSKTDWKLMTPTEVKEKVLNTQ